MVEPICAADNSNTRPVAPGASSGLQFTETPCCASSFDIVVTSARSGTFARTSGCALSRLAAIKRQRGVFRAADRDGAGKRHATTDQDLVHRLGSGRATASGIGRELSALIFGCFYGRPRRRSSRRLATGSVVRWWVGGRGLAGTRLLLAAVQIVAQSARQPLRAGISFIAPRRRQVRRVGHGGPIGQEQPGPVNRIGRFLIPRYAG